jgi:predicted DNA-binding transcriptional regulator AlpA
MIGKRVLRKREVLERLGIRKTTLYENFIKTGRLRFVKIGARAVGVIEDELDALIEELRRERDRKPRAVCERPDVNPLTAEDAAASTTEPIPVGPKPHARRWPTFCETGPLSALRRKGSVKMDSDTHTKFNQPALRLQQGHGQRKSRQSRRRHQ